MLKLNDVTIEFKTTIKGRTVLIATAIAGIVTVRNYRRTR